MIPRPRAPQVRRSTVVLVLAVAALALPLGALAVHQFSDVPTEASYHDDVEALVAAGVTSGCGGGKYCPGSAVTRGQMAQFLNRLGSLDGDTDPSVNAATAESVDGWSIDCPANTVFSQGKCFDVNQRGTAESGIYDASDSCASIFILGGHSWHLPSANELLSASRTTSLNLTSTSEWTSDMWFDDDVWLGTQVFRLTLPGPILLDLSAEAEGGDSAGYRCATYPYSADFTFILPLEEADSEAAKDGQLDQAD
jgi:hypothetical protein